MGPGLGAAAGGDDGDTILIWHRCQGAWQRLPVSCSCSTGQIRLNDPVANICRNCAERQQDITVRQLLCTIRLTEDLDLKDKDSPNPMGGEDTAYRMAFAEKPVFPPLSVFCTGDINFITLGRW